MAQLSFGVQGPTQDWTITMQIADGDSPRILAYLASPNSGYGTVTENIQSQVPDPDWTPGEGETEDDRPMKTVQEWVTRPATEEEAAQNYAQATLDHLLAATHAYEKQQAAEAAAAQITPITPL